MRIIIAPNAFKNSLDALQAAEAVSSGLKRSSLQAECLLQPIADGGDGMLEVILRQTQGKKLHVTVENPLGKPVQAAYGLINRGKTAVIEMTEASGLRLLRQEELNPMHTSTYGTGQLIKAAIGQGVQEIIIGVGGSATVDGGLGMAMALGVRLLDDQGNPVSKGARGLTQLHTIDASGIDNRLRQVKIKVACDVTNTLIGAAEVFGPQKGATPEMVKEIEGAFKKYSQIIKNTVGKDIAHLKHGGAAGGISATLYALFQAELVHGTELLLSRTGFHDELSQSDLLITAEGALDVQTQSGKGPFYVASQARAMEKPVIMLAGSLPANFQQQDYETYDAIFPIGAKPETLEEAIQNTKQNLIRTALQIGNLLALKNK